MGILPWTLGSITILILLSLAQFTIQTENYIIHQALEISIANNSKTVFKKISDKASSSFKNKDGSDRENLFTTLKLKDLFSQNDENQQKLFLDLVHILYDDLPIFSTDKTINAQRIQELFKEALQQIRTHPDHTTYGKENFHLVSFEGSEQAIKAERFHYMLEGRKGEILPDHYCTIPKLFEFVDIPKEPKKKMLSAFKAKTQILLAILKDENLVEQICEERKKIAKKLKSDKSEATVQKLNNDFQTTVSSFFPPDLQNSIDFDVYKFKNS